MESDRMRALRECAVLAARSGECSASVGYALAREIWGLWYEEKRRLESSAGHARDQLDRKP